MSKTAQIDAARLQLVRHPVAVECVRVASGYCAGLAEIAVAEADRAYVVASSDAQTVMLPRPLHDVDRAVLFDDVGESRDGQHVSLGIRNASGVVVAALSVATQRGDLDLDVLRSLGRLVASVLVSGADEPCDQQFMAAVLDGQRDAVMVLRPDFTIKWANRGVGSILGRSPLEAINSSAIDYIHPDDMEIALDAMVRISQGLEVYRLRLRLLTSSNTYVPVEVTGADLSADPTVGGLVLSVRDGQYDTEANSAVERAQRVSATILNGLGDGVIATDRVGAVTVANQATREIFGIDPDRRASELTLSDFQLTTIDGEPLQLGEVDAPEVVCKTVDERGHDRYLVPRAEAILGDDGDVLGTVVVVSDITVDFEQAARLRDQALHDQMTGLPNRRFLDEKLQEMEASEPAPQVAACFVDIDGFKAVNDNHGHRVGDQVIKHAAQRLHAEMRPSDILVRQGGDEFVVIMVGMPDLDEATRCAERFRRALERPFAVGRLRFDLTASLGVAAQPGGLHDADLLLQQADMALFAAKSRGRNQTVAFDDALSAAVQQEDAERRLLQEALEFDRLVMYFQPLKSADTGQTVGFEALARIRQDDGSILGPGSFIQSIAETSLMWELDKAAFTLTCRAAAEMIASAPGVSPHFAVNFSMISLAHPDFIEHLANTVASVGLDPRQFCIELTESAAFETALHDETVLPQLVEMGFRIALDDFGTGYSSLAHLRDLPITTVKIDRSFVNQLDRGSSERSIVEAVVGLSNALGLAVVAEGVETSEQLDDVRKIGVDIIQGWYYSAAKPLDECIAELAVPDPDQRDAVGCCAS